jgi:hypothetical protein
MPLIPILLSVLGLVPFVGLGLGALGQDPVSAGRMLQALISYASLILAFAGGIHWGFELQTPHSSRLIGGLRLGVPIIALLGAWAAVSLPLVIAPASAVILLIVAYIGAVLVEHRASERGLLPSRYLWLRWGFTVPAVAMLITVLTLRLLGQTIVL